MKKMATLLILSIFIGVCLQEVSAQTTSRTISGIVTSFEESLPLEGASITIKGTKRNTGTQADGVYYITINTEDSVLIVNYPGYETKEVKLTNSNQYDIVLHAGNHQPSAFLYSTLKPGELMHDFIAPANELFSNSNISNRAICRYGLHGFFLA
ncbi:MAG: carboxypeptidase-like regulatory domain-containing protein [Chitinophagaceae bacterium]